MTLVESRQYCWAHTLTLKTIRSSLIWNASTAKGPASPILSSDERTIRLWYLETRLQQRTRFSSNFQMAKNLQFTDSWSKFPRSVAKSKRKNKKVLKIKPMDRLLKSKKRTIKLLGKKYHQASLSSLWASLQTSKLDSHRIYWYQKI